MSQFIIEKLTEAHADLLFAAYQDNRIYTYLPGQAPPSLDALRREFKEFEEGAPPDSNEVWLNWVINRMTDQQILGTLQATLTADDQLWIGYTIVPLYWGNGVASEALRLLLGELRHRFGSHAVLASVDTRNLASIKVLERNGFTRLRKEVATIRGEPTEDYIFTFQL